MNYCILNDKNIIENIIVCENDEIAKEFNAVPSYETAMIGDQYNPPNLEDLSKRVFELERNYLSMYDFANYVSEGVELAI